MKTVRLKYRSAGSSEPLHLSRSESLLRWRACSGTIAPNRLAVSAARFRHVPPFSSPRSSDHYGRSGAQVRTLQVHAGQQPNRDQLARHQHHQTTSYTFDSSKHGADLFGLRAFGNIYSRIMVRRCGRVASSRSSPRDDLAALAPRRQSPTRFPRDRASRETRRDPRKSPRGAPRAASDTLLLADDTKVSRSFLQVPSPLVRRSRRRADIRPLRLRQNPTNDVFEKRVAALEGSVGAVAVSSGMSAVPRHHHHLSGGRQHRLHPSLYGGTYNQFKVTLRAGHQREVRQGYEPESFDGSSTATPRRSTWRPSATRDSPCRTSAP